MKKKFKSKGEMICIRNEGYETSLKRRKRYKVFEDEFAKTIGMIRVIDETGDSYLYPETFFKK